MSTLGAGRRICRARHGEEAEGARPRRAPSSSPWRRPRPCRATRSPGRPSAAGAPGWRRRRRPPRRDGEDRGDPVHRHAGGGDRVERADASRRLARRPVAAGDEHADRGDELPAAVEGDQHPRRPRRDRREAELVEAEGEQHAGARHADRSDDRVVVGRRAGVRARDEEAHHAAEGEQRERRREGEERGVPPRPSRRAARARGRRRAAERRRGASEARRRTAAGGTPRAAPPRRGRRPRRRSARRSPSAPMIATAARNRASSTAVSPRLRPARIRQLVRSTIA